ncbi:hypothetical protein G7Y79_00004g012410 [Physcia stellaris]|nr:hypothetical protein G7Y79_00004g012410 [Physcia stellaris]
METAVRWSPHSTTTISEQKFLVADVIGQFKLYGIKQFRGDELLYEALSTQRKVPQFRAFDWSPHDENLIAIGQWSGEATVLRLDDGKALSFPIKHQRLCNAVTFGHNALLATGLERVRNDFCLNVWDINRNTPTSPSHSSPRPGSRRQITEPLRQLASSEAVTSIKFFNQPDVLIAGVKGACLRIYDLRENAGTPSLQLPTSCVHNIAIDLLDDNYFASAATAKDSTIQIWDRRAGVASTAGTLSSGLSEHLQQGPIISYKKPFDHNERPSHASIWSLKYFFETKKNCGALHDPQTLQFQSAFDDLELMPQAIVTQQIYNIGSSPYCDQSQIQDHEQITAFDFTNLGGPHGRPCALVMRADKSIDIQELDGPPPVLTFSSLGSLAASQPRTLVKQQTIPADDNSLVDMLQILSANEGTGIDTSPELCEVTDAEPGIPGSAPSGTGEKKQLSSHESHERFARLAGSITIAEALAQLTTTRRRCSAGYLFNCKKNVEIVAHDPWLQELWTWIGRAKGIAADEGMNAQSVDFSYLGVFGIWNSDLGLAYQDLEADVKELLQQGQNTKAAALAVIHDQPKLAFNALRSGRTSSEYRELSLALAGFVKGTNDDTWDETVRDVAKELDDPYARAILALVSYGDWHDVLAETSLPLRYRVGVALMHLDDTELTRYIESATAECIKQGDIEGIILTGLTEKVVPLFQAYMVKFYDLQTPILALSFVSPRYFPSPLMDHWRDSYRSLLNTYRLFIKRVQFDVQATKLSVRSSTARAKPSLTPAPRQVSIRCNNCDQALDRNPEHVPVFATGPQSQVKSSFSANQNTSIFGDAKSGTFDEGNSG